MFGLGAYRVIDEEKNADELFPVGEVSLPSFPSLGDGTPVGESGVVLHELKTSGGGPGQSMTFRVYLPGGEHSDASLPCVIVAPAGSNLLTGLSLDGSDYHEETLPYAEAGMVVINYSLDGAVEDEDDTSSISEGYDQFRAAGAGVVNARNAIELAKQKLPMVDPQRIFSAGHSSAATLSLLNAAHLPELAGAIAYAPALDLEEHFADLLETPLVGASFMAIRVYVKKFSPLTHASKIEVPVFLFFAKDDSMVNLEDGRAMRLAIEDAGGDATLRSVPEGGHYQSMIDRGIPSGIEWIAEQLAKR